MPPNPSQSYRAKNEPAASGRTLFCSIASRKTRISKGVNIIKKDGSCYKKDYCEVEKALFTLLYVTF